MKDLLEQCLWSIDFEISLAITPLDKYLIKERFDVSVINNFGNWTGEP